MNTIDINYGIINKQSVEYLGQVAYWCGYCKTAVYNACINQHEDYHKNVLKINQNGEKYDSIL